MMLETIFVSFILVGVTLGAFFIFAMIMEPFWKWLWNIIDDGDTKFLNRSSIINYIATKMGYRYQNGFYNDWVHTKDSSLNHTNDYFFFSTLLFLILTPSLIGFAVMFWQIPIIFSCMILIVFLMRHVRRVSKNVKEACER